MCRTADMNVRLLSILVILRVVRRTKVQRSCKVGRASQHGAARGSVDDGGEVPRDERHLGSRGPSCGPVVKSEAELGKAVEDAAGDAVGKELVLAVEL